MPSRVEKYVVKAEINRKAPLKFLLEPWQGFEWKPTEKMTPDVSALNILKHIYLTV